MANLSGVIRELRTEPQRTQRQMDQIDAALAALKARSASFIHASALRFSSQPRVASAHGETL